MQSSQLQPTLVTVIHTPTLSGAHARSARPHSTPLHCAGVRADISTAVDAAKARLVSGLRRPAAGADAPAAYAGEAAPAVATAGPKA